MLRTLAAALAARHAARCLDRNGMVVLRGLLGSGQLRKVITEIERSWSDAALGVIASVPPNATNLPASPALRSRPGIRLLDPHWMLPAVREALLHPRIIGCLTTRYGLAPLLFQSQSFENSPRAVPHRDDAYLALSPNRSLVGLWLALEDIGPDQGGLEYVPGSHRIPPYRFGDGRVWFTPPLDDDRAHQRFVDFLQLECRQRGLKTCVFQARAGDAILWDGALVHGSSPMPAGVRSRRSIVGHYCSAAVSPRYLQEGAGVLAAEQVREARYATGYYAGGCVNRLG